MNISKKVIVLLLINCILGLQPSFGMDFVDQSSLEKSESGWDPFDLSEYGNSNNENIDVNVYSDDDDDSANQEKESKSGYESLDSSESGNSNKEPKAIMSKNEFKKLVQKAIDHEESKLGWKAKVANLAKNNKVVKLAQKHPKTSATIGGLGIAAAIGGLYAYNQKFRDNCNYYFGKVKDATNNYVVSPTEYFVVNPVKNKLNKKAVLGTAAGLGTLAASWFGWKKYNEEENLIKTMNPEDGLFSRLKKSAKEKFTSAKTKLGSVKTKINADSIKGLASNRKVQVGVGVAGTLAVGGTIAYKWWNKKNKTEEREDLLDQLEEDSKKDLDQVEEKIEEENKNDSSVTVSVHKMTEDFVNSLDNYVWSINNVQSLLGKAFKTPSILDINSVDEELKQALIALKNTLNNNQKKLLESIVKESKKKIAKSIAEEAAEKAKK